MNENKKRMLMNAVMNNTMQSVKYHIKRCKIEHEDEDFFDYELLKVALERKQTDIINLLLQVGCRVRNPKKIISEETPLHLAMNLHNTRVGSMIINKILENGASIYDKNKNGETAIYAGFKEEYHDAVNTVFNFLYKTQFSDAKNLNPMNEDDIHHFHIACILNNLNAVRQYLEFRIDINKPFSLDFSELCGLNPLHYAAKKLYSDLFELLLKYDGDLTVKNIGGQTPLQILYFSGPSGLRMIELAFNSKNDTKLVNSADNHNFSHFHLCCIVNKPNIVEEFISKGVDVNSAVSSTCSINAGFTPLHFAVKHGCDKIVEILLRNGADCKIADAKGTTPLHLACEKIDVLIPMQIIKTLLDACPAAVVAVDQNGLTPLHTAFYKTERWLTIVMLNILMPKIPREVNFVDAHGLSYLHILCTVGDVDRINDFLESGVPVDSCVVSGLYSGYTALHFAVLFNQKDVVELLLKKNAHINVKTSEWQFTPLHIACHSSSHFSTDYNDIIKLLLLHKANVNACSKDFTTPLQLVFNNCRNLVICQNIICTLLDHGISDVNVRNIHNVPILHFATKNCMTLTIKKLLYFDADINIEDSFCNSCLFYLIPENNALIILDTIQNYKNYSKICEIIFIHMQKLLALRLYVSEKVQKDCITLHEFYKTYVSQYIIAKDIINLDEIFYKCIDELERMKLVTVDKFNSLYSILLKNVHELVKNMKNSTLVKILKDPKTYDSFPLYAFLLKVPFKKALIRSDVLESANAALSSIIGFNLPEPCCDSILRHLTNEEVADLKTANVQMMNSLKRKMNNNSCNKITVFSTKLQKKI